MIMTRHQKKITIIILITATVISGLSMFLFFLRISLPYHERSDRVIGHITVVAISEPEIVGWPYYNRTLYGGDKLEYGESIELWVFCVALGTQSGHAVGRTLYRDEERVRVVYITRTETLFSLLHRWLLHRRSFISDIATRTDALQDIGYGHQAIEVYYLQSLHRQRRRVGRLSDEDFDALRTDSTYIWSGIIEIPE